MRKFAFLLILVLLTASFTPIIATPVTAQDGPIVYTDPAERFSVTLPAGWTDASTPDLAKFVSPDGLSAAFLVLPATDLETGIPSVLTAVGAAPDLEPLDSHPVTLPSGFWTQNIYSIGDNLGVLEAQYADGSLYAMWFEGSETVVNAAEADLVSIVSSYTNAAMVDLTGQTARDLTADDFAAFDAYINATAATFHVPGSAVAIVQNGQIVYASGFGVLDTTSNTPVTADSLFMIGSVTKSMTSLIAATLVDEGKLSWDQPATDILPQFALSDPAATPEIRVRDLFNMTSGIASDDLPLFLESPTPPELVASLSTIPMDGAPHTVYNYSNQMVGTGGFALAVVNGSTLENAGAGYADLLQTRVFTPLGMTSTTVDFDAALANPNHAVSYDYDPVSDSNRLIPLDWERFVTPIAPAGAVWSSVNDMGRYLIMQLARGVAADGTRVVSTENLTETQTAAQNPDGEPFEYAMGWVPDTYNGLTLTWHNGGTLGFTTYCGFLPDANLGIIILSNRAGAENYYGSVRDFVFEQAFDLPHESGAVYAESETQQWQAAAEGLAGLTILPIDAAAIEPYLGDYGTGLRVEMRGDTLWLVARFAEVKLISPSDGEAGQYVGFDTPVFTGLVVTFSSPDGQPQMEITIPDARGGNPVYQKQ